MCYVNGRKIKTAEERRANYIRVLEKNGGTYAVPLIGRDLMFTASHFKFVRKCDLENIWKGIIKRYRMALDKYLSPVYEDWDKLPIDEIDVNNENDLRKNLNHCVDMNVDTTNFMDSDMNVGRINSVPVVRISNTNLDLLRKYSFQYDIEDEIEFYGDFEKNLHDYLILALLQRVNLISLKQKDLLNCYTSELNCVGPKSLNEFILGLNSKRLSIITFAKNIGINPKKDEADVITPQKSLKEVCNKIRKLLMDPKSPTDKKSAFKDFVRIFEEHNCELLYNPQNSPISTIVVNDFTYNERDGRFELYLCKDGKVISRKKALNNHNSYILAIYKMLEKVNNDPDGHYLLMVGFINYFTPKEMGIASTAEEFME